MPTAKEESRGYYKIKGAADAFNFDFRNKVVLDIGSSTGGFTKYAKDHGARKIIAVEKGTNQMQHPLRQDPAVELHEKTNIFDYETEEHIDVILADVSFISLTKVLKYAKRHLADEDTTFMVMMKPQFEAFPTELTKGVVKNNKIRRDIIKRFEAWLKENSFIVLAKHDNALKGKNGNIERFYLLTIPKRKHIIKA